MTALQAPCTSSDPGCHALLPGRRSSDVLAELDEAGGHDSHIDSIYTLAGGSDATILQVSRPELIKLTIRNKQSI